MIVIERRGEERRGEENPVSRYLGCAGLLYYVPTNILDGGDDGLVWPSKPCGGEACRFAAAESGAEVTRSTLVIAFFSRGNKVRKGRKMHLKHPKSGTGGVG